MLVPDLGVTCTPATTAHAVPNPVLLVEVLAPSHEVQTRAKVWAYTTIPSVVEILIISSFQMSAEILRRRPDASWPEQPELVGPASDVRLESIGFTFPLQAAYRTAGL
jgi:Uma2 family endonuclease